VRLVLERASASLAWMMTVPTAIARVASQLTHISTVRQSCGPLRVAWIVPKPPKMALMMLLLKMNLRKVVSSGCWIPRYRLRACKRAELADECARF
jgi:hypothetical protein